MCASGVCQRITSGTSPAISAGSARSLSYCSGFSFKASTEPVIELRVVSLPPTISKMRLPSRLSRSMPRVAWLCAIMEMRSLFIGARARSANSRAKVSPHSASSARRCSSLAYTPLLGSAVATSDQRVSLRRSSQGKSNSVASICVVSSIDTRSTQLKVSLRGRLSSTEAERSRISAAILTSSGGVNSGCTAPRCSAWRGSSMAMKLGHS